VTERQIEMFNLSLDLEQSAIAEACKEFGRDRLRSAAEQAENNPEVAAKVLAELTQLGVTTPIAEEHGGQGAMDVVTYLVALEQLAIGDPGLTYAAAAAGHAALLIQACGTQEQKKRYLSEIAGSRQGASLLLHEPHGSDPTDLETVARLASGTWTISGNKSFVPLPGAADLAVIVAADAHTSSVVAFVTEQSPSPTYVITRDSRKTSTIGLRAAHTGDVELRELSLPDEARLAGEAGLRALLRAAAQVTLSVGAIALGAAVAATEYATAYAVDRVAFGQSIFDFQGVSFNLADRNIECDATRLELWNIAAQLDAVDPADASAAAELARAAHSVAARAGEIATNATRNCINVLGGHGFLTDHPIERWYRDAATLAVAAFDPLAVDLRLV
jgi:alkylation response protein AidB-like acyl-CoA dehydrogenase